MNNPALSLVPTEDLRAELLRRRRARKNAKHAPAKAAWLTTPRGKLLRLMAVYRYRLKKTTDPETRADIGWALADAAGRLKRLTEGGGT